jgi:hypothetical protein
MYSFSFIVEKLLIVIFLLSAKNGWSIGELFRTHESVIFRPSC